MLTNKPHEPKGFSFYATAEISTTGYKAEIMDEAKKILIAGKSYQSEKVLSALRTMAEEGDDASKKDRIKQAITITPHLFWPRKAEEVVNDAECVCQMVRRLNNADIKRLSEILDNGR